MDVETPEIDKPIQANASGKSEDTIPDDPSIALDDAPATDAEITSRGNVDVAALRAAYSQDAAVRLVIDHFAGRERNQRVANADTLVSALHRSKTPLPHPAVIRALRSLDALG